MVYYTIGDTYTVAELHLPAGFLPRKTRTKPSSHRLYLAENFQLVMASPASRTTQDSLESLGLFALNSKE